MCSPTRAPRLVAVLPAFYAGVRRPAAPRRSRVDAVYTRASVMKTGCIKPRRLIKPAMAGGRSLARMSKTKPKVMIERFQ